MKLSSKMAPSNRFHINKEKKRSLRCDDWQPLLLIRN